jgi:YidC/Oxa1 family membrane protein insertase
MEKRVILAIALCVAVIIFWTKFFPVRPPTPAPVAATPAAQSPEPSRPAAPGAGVGSPSGVSAAAAVNRPEKRIAVETPDVRFVFSSLGGTLVHAQLRGSKFLDRPNDPASGHDLVQSVDPKDAPLRTTFPGSGFAAPADGAWEVQQPKPDTVVFSTDSGNVHIEKRYVVDSTRYRLHLEVSLSNRGEQPIDHHLALSLTGRQDPDKRGGGFMSGSSANPASMLCSIDDKIERRPIDKLGKDPIDKLGAVKWIASDEKFFLLAAVPYPEPTPSERRCASSSAAYGTGEITLSFAERTIPAHGSVDYAFAVFDGPKFISDLDAVRPGGEEIKLDQAVDVTLAILSRPILSLLKFFYSFARNWGVAIILLTLFIKLVTFYPTQRSLLSAKKMQKLAPKMNAIRKKYENDRQRQSVETMNLYKAHGVSPFGGCLPSLIQMPIWIALYSTLNYAVELYRAPFFGHIHDLTAKDPFYITPLLMGGVMFAQMRMSPSGADQQQQQMMSLMMPVMFTAFSLFLPAGLALYMLTSYLIGILQQLYVNHLDRKGATAV